MSGWINDVLVVTPVAFTALPSSPGIGWVKAINDGKAANCGDGSCTTFGTTVTAGGGALKLLLWWNGTNWTLIGK